MVLSKNLPKTGGAQKSTFPEIKIKLEKGVFSPDTAVDTTELEVYNRIRTGDFERQQTELINKELTAHGKKTDRYGILKKQLHSATFGYSANRTIQGDISHTTNLINLDLDENDRETLIAARERIQSGEFPFIRACGASPSFALEGSFWANCYIEVNTFDRGKHKELSKLLSIDKDTSSEAVFNTLGEWFVRYIKDVLKDAVNIKFTKRSIKQPRFICHDKDLYINESPEIISLETLTEYIKDNVREQGESFNVRRTTHQSKKEQRNLLSELSKKNQNYLNYTFPIKDVEVILNNTLNWAEEIGRELIPNQQGNRNETLMVQSKAMAKFGVPIEVWLKYCIENYVYVGDLKVSAFTEQEINQVVSSSYNAVLRSKTEGRLFYADNDAIQEMLFHVESDNKKGIEGLKKRFNIQDIDKAIRFFKENLIIPCDTYHLNKGEYLSNRAKDIDLALQKYKRVELVAGTGIGKSYLSNDYKALPKLFCDRNGKNARVVIVDSLNIKAKSDAETYDNFGYTGAIVEELKLNQKGHISEGLYLKRGIEENKILVTNQMKVDTLVAEIYHHLGNDCPILFIVDEVQTLVKNYRVEGIRKIMKIVDNLNDNSEVIFQTGTPKDYWHSQGFHRVKFTNERGIINVDLRKRSDKFEADLLDLVEEFPKDKNLLIVKYNDKEAIDRAFELFTANDWLKEEEIVCIYSGNTKEQKAKYERRLLNRVDGQDSFEDKVHLVLCTSAIQEGVDIYCETRNAVTINFEKRGVFEWDSLVQYLDRVRVSSTTNKRALFYVGNAELDNKGFSGFIPKLEYEQTYNDLNDIAKAMTIKSDSSNLTSFSSQDYWSIRGRSIESGEMITYDYEGGKYIPDNVSLICELENVHSSKCTINEGFAYIERHFPYIKFNKKSYIDNVKIEPKIMVKIQEAEERSKELRDAAAKRFKNMLLANSELAIQTIIVASPNDASIKARFGRINPAHYRRAEAIIKSSADLYAGREYQYLQEIGAAYKHLTERMFLSSDSALGIIFNEEDRFTKSNIKKFCDEASIQYEVLSKELAERTFGELKNTSKQYQRIEKELAAIKKLEFGKALTRNELIDSVKAATRSKKNLRTMNQQECIDFVNRYCIVEDSRTMHGRFKTIKGLKSFDDFAISYSLTESDRDVIKGILGTSLSEEIKHSDNESLFEDRAKALDQLNERRKEWTEDLPF